MRARLDNRPTSAMFSTIMHSQMSRLHRRFGDRALQRGFTMMELLVVLAILALLAGLAITNVTGIFGTAQGQTADIFVKQTMQTPLFTYRMHMGDYPSTAEGLQALLNRPSTNGDRWHGPYIDKLPLDPWNEPYQYVYPGTHNKTGYDLWSKGPDKQSGTEDDIGNWEKSTAEAK
jgi:general secretion pathway protein G